MISFGTKVAVLPELPMAAVLPAIPVLSANGTERQIKSACIWTGSEIPREKRAFSGSPRSN